jgi:hypothetical protein
MSRSETVRYGYGGALTRSQDGHLADGTPAYLHIASAQDSSESNRTYDSRCGWCWLGAPHSTNAHRQKIERNH